MLLGFAESAVALGDVYTAIDFYEKYCKAKSDDFDALFELAKLYHRSRDYENAKEAYLKVYEADEHKYPMAHYYHAQMQKMTGEYEGATTTFQAFLKEYRGKDAAVFKKLIKVEIEGCTMGKEQKEKVDPKRKIEITLLDTSINHAHIEFSPILVDDTTLIYASLKADSIQYYQVLDLVTKRPVRKFYVAKLRDKHWVSTGELEGPFNDDKLHTGNGVFTPDNTRFLFTRCEANWQNKMSCSIYMCKRDTDNGQWGNPQKLPEPINNPKFITSQPAIGIDSRKNTEILYFISDRSGGAGGMDIWFAAYNSKKETYDAPKNAGKRINTTSDEMSPNYDISSHSMYFSSSGWPGLGGLDIFRTTGEMNQWTTPENIGAPVNSCTDDLYHITPKNSPEEGFFVSNRKGGIALKNPTCCDDIYYYKIKGFKPLYISGIIFDLEHADYIQKLENRNKLNCKDSVEIQRAFLENSNVSLFVVDEQNEREFVLSTKQVTCKNGKYLFKIERNKSYAITAQKDGYFTQRHEFSTKSLPEDFTDTMLYQDIGLNFLGKQPIVIKNIYYEFDDAALTKDAKVVIDTTLFIILTDNPEMIVEIGSHTDSKGTDDYNIKLSQRRAESVVNYLISKGIDKQRLTAKGYGELVPIAKNENPDGSDNPEGRAHNRRTEFRVIGKLDLEVIYQE